MTGLRCAKSFCRASCMVSFCSCAMLTYQQKSTQQTQCCDRKKTLIIYLNDKIMNAGSGTLCDNNRKTIYTKKTPLILALLLTVLQQRYMQTAIKARNNLQKGSQQQPNGICVYSSEYFGVYLHDENVSSALEKRKVANCMLLLCVIGQIINTQQSIQSDTQI